MVIIDCGIQVEADDFLETNVPESDRVIYSTVENYIATSTVDGVGQTALEGAESLPPSNKDQLTASDRADLSLARHTRLTAAYGSGY